MYSKPQNRRVAFLLNANARSVTRFRRNKLEKLVNKNDFYVSHSQVEAEALLSEIVHKGYSYLFCGGGDGTLVHSINCLAHLAKSVPESLIPRLGVLRLGTGNALARALGALKAEDDIRAVMQGKPLKPLLMSMVETLDGQLAPFAGIGYDGELMNDFETVKDTFFKGPFRKFFSSYWGFAIAGLFRTLPRQVGKDLPLISVKTSSPLYRIVRKGKYDEEVFLEKGQELFSGQAPLICVGTIPSVGYGVKMFPFAMKRPGYMQLRVSAVPLATLLSHVPAIWQGSYRHPLLYDFLVKDVTIESNKGLPYQFAGDTMGFPKNLSFKVSDNPIKMVSLLRDKLAGHPPSQALSMRLI
jgi:diacylglycerol kinase family enzyme